MLLTTAEDELTSSVRGYGGPAPGTVDVWWAALAQLRPTHETLLDRTERRRADAYVRPRDRERFVLAAALLRLVAGAATGSPAEAVVLDRRCDDCGRQHGRPVVVDAPWEVSVSHSGEHVVVAACRHRVGVDVERAAPSPTDARSLRRRVLAPCELARPAGADDARELLAYWVAKESALKATGEGLRTPMDRVVVPGPDQHRGAVGFLDVEGRTGWTLRLDAPSGYAAAVTTLGRQAPEVTVRAVRGGATSGQAQLSRRHA